MNELIKVSYENDTPTVSGRELHEKLKVATAYKDWFPRMCEYGFTECVDYTPLIFERVQNEGNRQVKRTVTDHQLTIPMAKEICMLQRSETGKMFRQHFIKIEEAWNDPDMVIKRAMQVLEHRLDSATRQIEELKPKAYFADAVSASKTCILIRDLAKLIKQNGVDIGEKRLYEYLRNNGYLCRDNMPTQRAMDLKLFEVKEWKIESANGERISHTTKVTGKGQRYFIDKFCVRQLVAL